MTATEAAVHRKEFVRGDDGCVYWWPDGYVHGCFTEHHLKELALALETFNLKLDLANSIPET